MGLISYMEYRHKIEFGDDDFQQIDQAKSRWHSQPAVVREAENSSLWWSKDRSHCTTAETLIAAG